MIRRFLDRLQDWQDLPQMRRLPPPPDETLQKLQQVAESPCAKLVLSLFWGAGLRWLRLPAAELTPLQDSLQLLSFGMGVSRSSLAHPNSLTSEVPTMGVHRTRRASLNWSRLRIHLCFVFSLP